MMKTKLNQVDSRYGSNRLKLERLYPEMKNCGEILKKFLWKLLQNLGALASSGRLRVRLEEENEEISRV